MKFITHTHIESKECLFDLLRWIERIFVKNEHDIDIIINRLVQKHVIHFNVKQTFKRKKCAQIYFAYFEKISIENKINKIFDWSFQDNTWKSIRRHSFSRSGTHQPIPTTLSRWKLHGTHTKVFSELTPIEFRLHISIQHDSRQPQFIQILIFKIKSIKSIKNTFFGGFFSPNELPFLRSNFFRKWQKRTKTVPKTNFENELLWFDSFHSWFAKKTKTIRLYYHRCNDVVFCFHLMPMLHSNNTNNSLIFHISGKISTCNFSSRTTPNCPLIL